MSTEEILFNVFMFLVFFLILFILLYIMNVHKYKSKKKKQFGEIVYLVNKFQLDEKRLPKRKMLLWISILDAFIISFVGTFIFMLPIDYIWRFLIGFVFLFALIYALYEIYGRHLVNKGYQKGKKE